APKNRSTQLLARIVAVGVFHDQILSYPNRIAAIQNHDPSSPRGEPRPEVALGVLIEIPQMSRGREGSSPSRPLTFGLAVRVVAGRLPGRRRGLCPPVGV